MAEKLLLHLQYEAHKKKIPLPWKEAVRRLSPGSSEQAALQQLAKWRHQLIPEGHFVPPRLGRAGPSESDDTRGYIRDMNGKTENTARAVDWYEVIEDRRESLPTSTTRGSGNYRKHDGQCQCKVRPNGTPTKKRPIKEDDETNDEGISMGDIKPFKDVQKSATEAKKASSAKKTKAVRTSATDDEGRNSSSDASDDDFDPFYLEKSITSRGRGFRATQPKRIKLGRTSDEEYEKYYSEKHSEDVPEEDPETDGEPSTTPVPGSRMVTFPLPSERLAQFPSGESRPMSTISKMARDVHDMTVDTTPTKRRYVISTGYPRPLEQTKLTAILGQSERTMRVWRMSSDIPASVRFRRDLLLSLKYKNLLPIELRLGVRCLMRRLSSTLQIHLHV
jgi:hypothetical protein